MEAIMRALALALFVVGLAQAVSAQETPRPEGWVVISVDEYRALRLKAYPPEPPPQKPPAEVALTRVDYDLHVDGEWIAGELRLTADVLADGWVAVPVPSGLIVKGARVDGQPVSLVNPGEPQVLLSKPGRTVIAVDVVLPLSVTAGSESVTVPPARAAIARVALVVPKRDIDLAVNGGVLVERPAAMEKPWVAYASAGEPLKITWTKHTEDVRSAQPTRFRGSVIETVGLSEETGLVTANVRIEVTQGVSPAVVLTLPAGLVVNQVSGPLVGDWEFTPGSLKVTFLEPLSAQTGISIAAEVPVAREGTIAVPLVRLAGAEREVGGIAVEVLGAGEITERQPRGLDPADPSDLGDGLASRATPSMIAFRYRPQAGDAARELAVNVLRYTPQAVLVANVEEARYDALAGEEGKTLVRARYAVRNNQRAFLSMKLPEGATLWSAVVASRPLRPGVSSDGALLVPLVKGRSGEDTPPFAVEVTYVQRSDSWGDEGRARLVLPALDLPVSRTGLVLHYSPRFRIKLEPGTFHAQEDNGPFTDVLRREEISAGGYAAVPAGVVGGVVGGLPEAPPPPGAPTEQSVDSTAKLISDFQRQSAGRTVRGVVPVRVPFPEFGETLFVVSELTAEGQGPSLDLSYKREARW
jgi:hypothetical protein